MPPNVLTDLIDAETRRRILEDNEDLVAPLPGIVVDEKFKQRGTFQPKLARGIGRSGLPPGDRPRSPAATPVATRPDLQPGERAPAPPPLAPVTGALAGIAPEPPPLPASVTGALAGIASTRTPAPPQPPQVADPDFPLGPPDLTGLATGVGPHLPPNVGFDEMWQPEFPGTEDLSKLREYLAYTMPASGEIFEDLPIITGPESVRRPIDPSTYVSNPMDYYATYTGGLLEGEDVPTPLPIYENLSPSEVAFLSEMPFRYWDNPSPGVYDITEVDDDTFEWMNEWLEVRNQDPTPLSDFETRLLEKTGFIETGGGFGGYGRYGGFGGGFPTSGFGGFPSRTRRTSGRRRPATVELTSWRI